MTLFQIIRLRRAALSVLLMIALGVVSFGHRAPTQKDASVEAYLLAGFALADLCGSTGPEHATSGVPCQACTPPAAVLLPDCSRIMRDADIQVVAIIFAPRARQTVPAVHDPARAPRAPPLA